MIFAVRGSRHLVGRRGVVTVLVVTVVIMAVVTVVTVVAVVVMAVVAVVLVVHVFIVVLIDQVWDYPQHRRLGEPKMDALSGLDDDRVGLDLHDDAVETEVSSTRLPGSTARCSAAACRRRLPCGKISTT